MDQMSDADLVRTLKARLGDADELEELASRLRKMQADRRHAELQRELQQHKARMDRLENLLSRSNKAAELRSKRTDDFTDAGCVMVVANALLFASEPLQQACMMLNKVEPGTNSSVLNGYLYMATVLLQSVLDGVASTCQKICPVDGCNDVYFCSYNFFKSDVVWVSGAQRAIAGLTWRDKSFNKLANELKHEHAWVGTVNVSNGVHDIYDEQGTGFVYGLLVPVYKKAKVVVQRLTNQLQQSAPAFPDV